MDKGAVIMPSHYEEIRKLEKTEQADVYDAICRFVFYGEVSELEGTAGVIFRMAIPFLEAAGKRFDVAQRNANKRWHPAESRQDDPEAIAKAMRLHHAGRMQLHSANEMLNTNNTITTNTIINTNSNMNTDKAMTEEANIPVLVLKEEKAETLDPFAVFAGDDKGLLSALRDFEEMLERMGRPVKDSKKNAYCRDLRNHPKNQWTKIVRQSIERGWDFFYRLSDADIAG